MRHAYLLIVHENSNVLKRLLESIDNVNNDIGIYIYKKDDKYYLEQTNNGIYETSLNDFNTIKEYIKD